MYEILIHINNSMYICIISYIIIILYMYIIYIYIYHVFIMYGYIFIQACSRPCETCLWPIQVPASGVARISAAILSLGLDSSSEDGCQW